MGVWNPGPGATSGNDTFTGDGSDETANGSGGNDILNGNGGADTLNGGIGDDILSGGAGDDILTLAHFAEIGLGDAYVGGTDFDTFRLIGTGVLNVTESDFSSIERVEFFGGAGTNLTTVASQYGAGLSPTLNVVGTAFTDIITINANAGTTTTLDVSGFTTNNWSSNDLFAYVGNGFVDNYTGTDYWDNISGGGGSDTLRGNGASDTIIGGDGNDSLYGGEGLDTLSGGAGADFLRGDNDDDILIGGAGGDTLAGGAGIDTANYQASTGYVNVDLQLGQGFQNDAAGDTLTSIEGIVGSAFDDVLHGRDYVNNIISGGAGDDIIEGGYGADILDGGDGVDGLLYMNSLTAVDIRLFSNSAAGGEANGDVISNFEAVVGSAFTDTLAGNELANFMGGLAGNETITGREGDDELSGGEGNDTLLGGADNDILHGALGADTLGGGAGDDTADYRDSNAAVTINLHTGAGSGGHATGDTLVSIERVLGSEFNDVIIGKANAWDNVFNGGNGNDTITGGLGNDEFVFRMNQGNDTITDFVAGGVDDIISMTNWGLAINTFEEVMVFAAQAGADTVFTFSNGQTLTLQNVTMANLTADDFFFGG